MARHTRVRLYALHAIVWTIVGIGSACSSGHEDDVSASGGEFSPNTLVRIAAAQPSGLDPPLANSKVIALGRSPAQVIRACREAAAKQAFPVLCPMVLPYPTVGWPPGSLPPPMRVDLQNDKREFFIDVSYGAPWEPTSGEDWKARRWRNRPCCFLHFGLYRAAADFAGASLRQVRLGGRRGTVLEADGQGPYFGNHLRFAFVERSVHWVASLHAFGLGTEHLLGTLLENLRIMQSREPDDSSAELSRLVGGSPVAVALTPGDVWVATQGDAVAGVPGEVIRVSRETRRILSRLSLGPVRALVARGDWVWASTVLEGHTTILQIDSRTGKIVRRTELTDRGFAEFLTVLDDRVWVSSLSGVVSELDARTGRVVRSINIGGPLGGIAASATSVWVAKFEADSVVRMDAKTGRILATVSVGRAPRGVLASSDAVWVANVGSGTLSVIDPATNRVAETISVGGSPYGIASARGSIYAADPAGGRIVSIDSKTRKLRGSALAIGGDPLAIASDTDETLWVVRSTMGDLLRLRAP